MKRKDIMDKCPEEFEEDLKDFIDSIEHRVNEVEGKMDIKDIGDIADLNDAYTLLKDIAEDLY